MAPAVPDRLTFLVEVLRRSPQCPSVSGSGSVFFNSLKKAIPNPEAKWKARGAPITIGDLIENQRTYEKPRHTSLKAKTFKIKKCFYSTVSACISVPGVPDKPMVHGEVPDNDRDITRKYLGASGSGSVFFTDLKKPSESRGKWEVGGAEGSRRKPTVLRETGW